MANFHDQQAMILENLRDAGCDAHLCESVLHYLCTAQIEQIPHALCLLRHYKRQLLMQLHEDERKIDRLDYLIHQLNQMVHNQKG
ncbi:MAG: hypothetical protein UDG94_00400 [Peptococcaceae bacterium]|nr:hypothetical protein [Peptococcaceae bacterium]